MTAQASQPPGEMYCPTCEKTFSSVEHCPDDGGRLVRLGQQDPFIGRELDGRYTILERIGRGGMGMVYRADQHSVGREVAIKVVGSGWATDPDMIKRFLREAKLASRLSHPNAVSVLDFGQTSDGVFYL
ncbi:MAG TPA: protein kinase, partial [Kofleriaceae bacterium]|nr:protein kinase [Kofleriaceae bacterium]